MGPPAARRRGDIPLYSPLTNRGGTSTVLTSTVFLCDCLLLSGNIGGTVDGLNRVITSLEDTFGAPRVAVCIQPAGTGMRACIAWPSRSTSKTDFGTVLSSSVLVTQPETLHCVFNVGSTVSVHWFGGTLQQCGGNLLRWVNMVSLKTFTPDPCGAPLLDRFPPPPSNLRHTVTSSF